MGIYTNFYLQVLLCIASFIPIFFLMKAGDRLSNKLEEKIKAD